MAHVVTYDSVRSEDRPVVAQVVALTEATAAEAARTTAKDFMVGCLRLGVGPGR